MTLHVFGNFLTPYGTAANNRGLTEGNTVTLQKLIWHGQVHTTVSAESIRFALRRQLAQHGPCNRTYDDATRTNEWKDAGFAQAAKGKAFIDDDLLGYMSAEAAKDDGTKGGAKVRRSVLEVTRAVSLTPWMGDVTFNAASPGATPSAQKKGTNPAPYSTEMHATRYQYGIAMTPERLFEKGRAVIALRELGALGAVAGNQGRFLYDFSPEAVVFRLTLEAAPRILHCFQSDLGGAIRVPELLAKVKGRDILANELVIGGSIVSGLSPEEREALSGASLYSGVRDACEAVCKRLAEVQ